MLLSCHDPLYRYARALSRDPAQAEELVQETFKRALAARRPPDPLTPDNVRPWAFTILRHIWLDALHASEREAHPNAAEFDVADERNEPMEALLTRQLLRSEIVHAIDALPAQFREVVVLREIEGMSYAQIAAVVECPPGTVMSRLARARELLRVRLMRFAPFAQEAAR